MMSSTTIDAAGLEEGALEMREGHHTCMTCAICGYFSRLVHKYADSMIGLFLGVFHAELCVSLFWHDLSFTVISDHTQYTVQHERYYQLQLLLQYVVANISNTVRIL
jgi:hypothetical protein